MIVIDSREKKDVIASVTKYLTDAGLDNDVAFMETGDFLIVCKDGTPVCVEHKRMDDLIMSVKDGHLVQQCNRMLEEFEHVHLLVAGPTMQAYSYGPTMVAPFRKGQKGGPVYSSIDMRRLAGALTTIQKAGVVVDWWPIHDAVGQYLQALKNYYEKDEHEHARVRERRIVFTRKPPVTEAIERLGIPGVGAGKAEALAAHFRSVRALAVAEHGELLTVDGIGKKVAQDIVDFFEKEAA